MSCSQVRRYRMKFKMKYHISQANWMSMVCGKKVPKPGLWESLSPLMKDMAQEVTEISWILHQFKNDLSFAFLMCVVFKNFYHCNTILRSTGEVSRGSILFIFYSLSCRRKGGRESYGPSMAVSTTSKALWQTCTSAVHISHWVGASVLRMDSEVGSCLIPLHLNEH